MRLKPIAPEEVINLLLNDVTVYRLTVNSTTLANLENKSIKSIKKDLEKEGTYLYFIIVGGEANND